jgi:hypothetical protein
VLQLCAVSAQVRMDKDRYLCRGRLLRWAAGGLRLDTLNFCRWASRRTGRAQDLTRETQRRGTAGVRAWEGVTGPLRVETTRSIEGDADGPDR